MESWKGVKVKTPESKIGKVIVDTSRGLVRELTVALGPGIYEKLILRRYDSVHPGAEGWRWYDAKSKKWKKWNTHQLDQDPFEFLRGESNANAKK